MKYPVSWLHSSLVDHTALKCNNKGLHPTAFNQRTTPRDLDEEGHKEHAALQSENQLYDTTLELSRSLDVPKDWDLRDSDHVAWLTRETISSGHSVLIFCGTKRVWYKGLGKYSFT